MANKIIFQGKYWDININLSFGVPGYLFVRHSIGNGDKFTDIEPNEYAEMGKMIGLATSAAEHCLGAQRVFAGKFGLMLNHPVHFHIVPVYDWILEEFAKKTDLTTLQNNRPDDYPLLPDGAEIVSFVWQEYCFTGQMPKYVKSRTNLDEIVQKLSHYIEINKLEFGFSDE